MIQTTTPGVEARMRWWASTSTTTVGQGGSMLMVTVFGTAVRLGA